MTGIRRHQGAQGREKAHGLRTRFMCKGPSRPECRSIMCVTSVRHGHFSRQRLPPRLHIRAIEQKKGGKKDPQIPE